MKREEIRVCILRVGGTNCDEETKRAFEELKVQAEIVHLEKIVKDRSFLDYNALVLPGGFSYGDYIRAGVIWAKRILAKLGKELNTFIDEKRPILGICNGFQVLVEAGLLPGFESRNSSPQAALATNFPPGYNCRWIHVKQQNNGNCIFTSKIPAGKILKIPVAHSEGRFIFKKEHENHFLDKLYQNDQIVFRYCNQEGSYANGEFPFNPNGSFHDIAGICNPEGKIFGLMPHPERSMYWWQQPDWTTKDKILPYGGSKLIFEGLIEYLVKSF